MSKYSVDVFTEDSLGTKFPEQSYDADTVEDVAKIISNCTRKIAGIREVLVVINEPDDREEIETRKYNHQWLKK